MLVTAALPFGVAGSHRWGTYHWACTGNPMRIQVIDSMTPDWDARLRAVNGDWNRSAVIENTVVAGSATATTRASCPPVSGKIRSCNAAYGSTGWLGIASVRTSGGHIVDGTAKMNDTYFASSSYNSEAARRHVICQEIGHLFGLGHNRGSVTCMNDVAGVSDPAYQVPNAHDYSLLERIYGHADGSSSISSQGANVASRASRVPDPVGRGEGGSSLFVTDLGDGEQVFTFVLWVDETKNLEDDHAAGEGDHAAADAPAADPGSDPTSTRGRNPRATDAPAVEETSVATAPAAPTGLTATARGDRVVLGWTDAAGDETAYRVYRSADNGATYAMVAELGAGATRYLDRDAAPGTATVYAVAAVNGTGEAWSAPVVVAVE